jgi:putative endonuclease
MKDTEPHWVYILQSKKDGKFYTGVTSDLDMRIRAHNAGKVQSTRFRRPLVLIHQESYATKARAMDRERFLKTPAAAQIKQEIMQSIANAFPADISPQE